LVIAFSHHRISTIIYDFLGQSGQHRIGLVCQWLRVWKWIVGTLIWEIEDPERIERGQLLPWDAVVQIGHDGRREFRWGA
jgi:hypothetical protein